MVNKMNEKTLEQIVREELGRFTEAIGFDSKLRELTSKTLPCWQKEGKNEESITQISKSV